MLEHDLKKQLEQTHIILRISLFGLSVTEAIEESVSNAWMNAYLEDKGWNEKSETLGKFKDKLARLPWPENVKNVVSFNPVTLMDVENYMNGKTVVLVFDDLERSKLDTIDVKRNNILYNMSLPVWRAIFLPYSKKPYSAGFAAIQ